MILIVQTLWAENIPSTTDVASLNAFGRNEIEVCAYFIGTSSHCVFSNTIQNELAADGVSGPVLGLVLDYLTEHYHTGKDIHEVRPLNGLKAMPSEIT